MAIAVLPLAPHALVTAGIVGLIGWRIYRRMRRLIGRQPVRRWALGTTATFFTLAIVALAMLNAVRPPMLEGLGVGCVLGIALGVVGLKLTRFEACEAGYFYVPNTMLGVAVSLLFIGRLVYRLAAIYTSTGSVDPAAMQSFGSSALTLACFALVAGYYVTFSIGVLAWYRTARAARTTPANAAGTPLA